MGKDYLDTMKDSLSKQQIELLNGRYIKAHEGMIYGQMYADWKKGVGMNENEQ